MNNRISIQTGVLLIFCFSPLLINCNSGDSAIDQAETPIKDVSIYEVRSEEVRQVIEGFGHLAFRRKADITTAVDGTISEINVEEGDAVNGNQLLASLFNIQLKIRKAQAEAALFSAESAYELAGTQYKEGRLQTESRLITIEKSKLNLKQKELELKHQSELLQNKKELLSIGGTTKEEVAAMELAFCALDTEIKILEKDILINRIGFRDEDIISFGFRLPSSADDRKQILLDINSLSLKSEQKVAEARVKSAETELDSAEALLNETKLYSPIDGIVGAKYMEAGERVKADAKLFTIFDAAKVDLVFAVPEEIGVMLTLGQKVELSLDAVEDRMFTAEIRQISPMIDTRSGNITVKAVLDNGEGLFKPGMFSRFSITYGSPRHIMRIPAEALVRKDGNRAIVMRITEGRVYPLSIAIEAESKGMHEISSGLNEKDMIILNPPPLLKEGDPVNVL